MMSGTRSNTEPTLKYERVKVQNDIHTSKHIYKQISPIFNCVTLENVSLTSLASQLYSPHKLQYLYKIWHIKQIGGKGHSEERHVCVYEWACVCMSGRVRTVSISPSDSCVS